MASQAPADRGPAPAEAARGAGFLGRPPSSARAEQMFDEDTGQLGYVMNLTRLWTHRPALHDALGDLVQASSGAANLSLRQRGILVTARASTFGDSYCSLAWGQKLADEVADPELAARGAARPPARGDGAAAGPRGGQLRRPGRRLTTAV